jgi:hypothetical protein
MAETNSEGINIAATAETTQGASPPPTTEWLNLEADAIGDPGASYKKMSRNPFTVTRQLRRPFVSGLDATLSLDVDAIKDHIDFFGEAMFKSAFKHSGGTNQSLYRPTAVTATGYTVASNGALADNLLAYARGFTTPANNGLKLLAGTSTGTEIKTTGLVAEAAPPANATVEVAGVQGAAGDIDVDANGDFTSTALDFTLQGLQVGQVICVPSQAEATAMGDVLYAFSNANYYGFAKIKSITATTLKFEWRTWTVGAASPETTTTVRIFFTKWVRNVARSHADEKLVSHAFEVTYPGLATGPADAYEYLYGYMLDQVTFNIPPEGKVSMQMAFVGMTAGDPVTARVTGPSAARNVVATLAMSTSSDFKRLSIDNVDGTGLTTDFGDSKIMIKNNIQAEKAVNYLGNRFTPLGTFEVQTEDDLFFTKPEVVTAVHDNRIVRRLTAMRNDDFGLMIEMPAMGMMESAKKIEHNKLVHISSKVAGFMDPTYAYTAGMSVFAYLPKA